MKFLSVLLYGLVNLSHGSPPKKPHIVIIVADDMGYQDVGFRGSDIRTPNIDKLAREGVILQHHYVNAVCAPTRASLMTGRYAVRTGFWRGNLANTEEFGLGLDETLLPEMLKRNGYSTHGVGKWHCGSYTWDHTPAKRGFDTFFGLFLGGQDYFTHRQGRWLDFREDYHDTNGDFVDHLRDDMDGLYSTNLFSEKSQELIRNHDKTRPLFLYLAYTAPHAPHQAPLDEIRRFSSGFVDPIRRNYATRVSIMDEGIGNVTDTLREQGMMDNTILIFTADNGARHSDGGSNFPLRGAKGTYFEGGIRAVAFVNSPLLRKTGYTNTNLHHVTDWYATFRNLVGDDPRKYGKVQLPIDGVDIWSSLNEGEPCREEVLLNLKDPLKYLDNPDENSQEFMRADICEECGEVTGVKVRGWTPSTNDFFALRWKNWKFITGSSFKIDGWSSKSKRRGFPKFSDSRGTLFKRAIASGTMLFDLSSDEREERNLANKYPEIVAKLLAKKQGYLKIMIPLKERKFANISMEDKVYRPWVNNDRIGE
jgi:arylsulfatase A-like enzyme